MPRSPLHNSTLRLPPLLSPSIGIYALIHACENCIVDTTLPFDKRLKDTHRFTIADTRGSLDLTVPIAKPLTSHCPWDDINISTHGNWWDVHRIALESAYGRTPYFEFYIDRFLPMLTAGVEQRFPTITSLSSAWDKEIRSILLLPPPLSPVSSPDVNTDLRCVTLTPDAYRTLRRNATFALWVGNFPYWQVREHTLGFIPGLSILDLIFNIGPEATLYLDRLLPAAKKYLSTLQHPGNHE